MPQKAKPKRRVREPQHQKRQPGLESRMKPRPKVEGDRPGSGRLAGKAALVNG